MYITRPTPSLASIFAGEGYETIAIHPNDKWFWNRDVVYQHLGFDKFISIEQFNNPSKEKRGYFVDDVEVTKSIIDESNLSEEEQPNMIGRHCIIGSDEEYIKNSDYPDSLFSSITLIGKNTHILDGSRIGGGCYVASGLGHEYFMTKKYLYDGTSVIK